MKSVMLSIKPKWCEMIARGQKTIEVRKTRPKLEAPFKCYIYCTKADQRLIDIIRDGDENYGEIYHGKPVFIKIEKGSVCDMYGKRQKVIGEFVCDEILQFNRDDYNSPAYDISDDDLNRTCLLQEDLYRYASGKTLYGWHISELVIYDEPRELSEFLRINRECWYADLGLAKRDCPECKNAECFVSRPPQSWCYVEAV